MRPDSRGRNRGGTENLGADLRGNKVMKQTPNYNLNKLEGSDTADLTRFNPNWDTLDTNLKQLSDDHVAHQAETVQNDDVHGLKTLFQNQQFENLLRNGDFESWSTGDSSVPDRWVSGVASATITKEITNVYEGNYAAKITNALDAPASLRQNLPSELVTYLKGRKVIFAAAIKATTANRVKIGVYDGVNSAIEYHTGDSNYQLLKISFQVSTNATELRVYMQSDSGSVIDAYFDAAILVIGELPVVFAKSPQDYVDKHVADYANHGQFKNKLINGNFDIWQRMPGAVGAVHGYYGPDRWSFRGTDSTGGSVMIYRNRNVVGLASYVNITRTGCTSHQYMVQKIEDLMQFSGKTLTLSLVVWNNTAEDTRILVRGNYGGGGTPSPAEDYIAERQLGDIRIGRHSTTFSIPDLSTKNFGSNNDDYLEIYIIFKGTHDNSLRLWEVQLEEGEYATPFEQRPIGLELALCQRYYEKSYDLDDAPGTSMATGVCWFGAGTETINHIIAPVRYTVTKRVAPTITLFDLHGNINKVSYSHAAPNKTGTADQIGNAAFRAYTDNSTAKKELIFHWTADAEL